MTSPSPTTADTATPRDMPRPADVTVLGLGAMGSALARAFLGGSHQTMVWNRTPGRADGLVAAGATLARSLRDAVTAGPLVIVCVLDHDAVLNILRPVADDLAGRTVVNLTSATPERARETAQWAGERGINYISGSIMVSTPLIGTDDALVLYSGDRHAFNEHRPLLEAVAADSDFLGDDSGLASVYDLGMLDMFFTGMTGILHAMALVGADGVSAKTFLPYAHRIGSLLQHTATELAQEVDSGTYPGDQDNTEMELAAVDHIVEWSEAREISTALPRLVQAVLRDTIGRGHGRSGFSSVIEVLREPADH